MPLYLLAPGDRVKTVKGQRRPNRYYFVRGDIAGRSFDVSTKTTDLGAAQAFKAALELDTLRGASPSPGDGVTFARAIEAFIAFKSPGKPDLRRLKNLKAAMGQQLVGDVTVAHFVEAAELLHPKGKNATKNREVFRPGAAVLHYAADNRWCQWLRVRVLDEGPVATRAASLDVGEKILEALAVEIREAKTERLQTQARKKRLLVAWLFAHGNRISDPLRLDWSQIDLGQRTYLLYVAKGKKWRTKPLDDGILPLLANEPVKSGALFPWRTRYGVYKWLRPLCKRLGVTFTPHMARHYLGKELNRSGAGLKTIMGALDHSSATSSLRYQDADIEIVREANTRATKALGNLLSKGEKK